MNELLFYEAPEEIFMPLYVSLAILALTLDTRILRQRHDKCRNIHP